MLEDLEAQAEALQHRERAAEVADRARTEYAAVTLDARLMATVGGVVEVDVLAVGHLRGEVARVGPGWCELGSLQGTWWLRTAAITSVRGVSDRALPEVAWSPVDRLGLASVLRRLSDESETVVVVTADGSRHEGTVRRVGADFLELDGAGSRLVALAHLVGVRPVVAGEVGTARW